MKNLMLVLVLLVSGIGYSQEVLPDTSYTVKVHSFRFCLEEYLESNGIDNFLGIGDRYILSDSATDDRIHKYNPDFIKKMKKQLKKFKNGNYIGLEIDPSLKPIMTLEEFRNSLKGVYHDPFMNMTGTLDLILSNFHNGIDTDILTTETFIFGVHKLNLNRNGVITILFTDIGILENGILRIETILIVETIDGSFDKIHPFNIDKYSN